MKLLWILLVKTEIASCNFLSVQYSFSGDPHLNFALTVLAELPSIPFGYFVVNRWGRRPMLGFMQLLSGQNFSFFSKLQC
jgi:hypothetical protein